MQPQSSVDGAATSTTTTTTSSSIPPASARPSHPWLPLDFPELQSLSLSDDPTSDGDSTTTTRQPQYGEGQLPEPSRKVWAGECLVCNKQTINKCNVCKIQFYCSNHHAKIDSKNHRKECAKTLREIQQWKKNKALDIVKDVLAPIARIFRGEAETPDDDCNKNNSGSRQPPSSAATATAGSQQPNQSALLDEVACREGDGTWSAIPLKLSVGEDGGRVWYLQIRDSQPWTVTWKAFEEKGFTREHFDQIECLGKASMYNSATALALQELMLRFDSKFEFAKDEIDHFWLCNVKVTGKCHSIVVNYPNCNKEDGRVQNTWKTEQVPTDKHQLLVFRTKGMGELFVDFTGPQFGIHQKMVPNVEMPIWICPFDKQKLYQPNEKLSAQEVRNELEKQVKENVENRKTDYYPTIVLRYSQLIVQTVILRKMRQLNKLHRPRSSVQLEVHSLTGSLLEEYTKRVQQQNSSSSATKAKGQSRRTRSNTSEPSPASLTGNQPQRQEDDGKDVLQHNKDLKKLLSNVLERDNKQQTLQHHRLPQQPQSSLISTEEDEEDSGHRIEEIHSEDEEQEDES